MNALNELSWSSLSSLYVNPAPFIMFIFHKISLKKWVVSIAQLSLLLDDALCAPYKPCYNHTTMRKHIWVKEQNQAKLAQHACCHTFPLLQSNPSQTSAPHKHRLVHRPGITTSRPTHLTHHHPWTAFYLNPTQNAYPPLLPPPPPPPLHRIPYHPTAHTENDKNVRPFALSTSSPPPDTLLL
jgi:hypothetical protein